MLPWPQRPEQRDEVRRSTSGSHKRTIPSAGSPAAARPRGNEPEEQELGAIHAALGSRTVAVGATKSPQIDGDTRGGGSIARGRRMVQPPYRAGTRAPVGNRGEQAELEREANPRIAASRSVGA